MVSDLICNCYDDIKPNINEVTKMDETCCIS